MTKLTKQFIQARDQFIKLIDDFPRDMRENKLFGEWNLKQILIHLTGWSKYQTEVLIEFKKGYEFKIHPNLKSTINEDLVAQKSALTWNQVYRDFILSGKRLVDEYNSLSDKLWSKKIWTNEKTTPKDFIQIEINHYKNTHGPQIKQVRLSSQIY